MATNLADTSAPHLDHTEAKAKDKDKGCHPCPEKLTMWKCQVGPQTGVRCAAYLWRICFENSNCRLLDKDLKKGICETAGY